MDLPDLLSPDSASRNIAAGSILDMVKENNRALIPGMPCLHFLRLFYMFCSRNHLIVAYYLLFPSFRRLWLRQNPCCDGALISALGVLL